MRISLTVNGERREADVWAGESLLFALRDRLAVVADAVDREHRLVAELEPVHLLPGHVLVRQHRVDARHRHRLGDLDRNDARVGVGAADGLAPEHPGGGEVARVGELAGRLRDSVAALDDLADTAELEPAHGRAHAPAAIRTASKIFA